MTNTQQFVDEFVSASKDKELNLTQLNGLLTKVYNNVYNIQKKPSEYNLYVKSKMVELKSENPDKNAKELMKLVAEHWKKEKTSSLKLESLSEHPSQNPEIIENTTTITVPQDSKKPVKKMLKNKN